MGFPQGVAVSVSVVATAIADGKSAEETALLGAIFTQLGDTITTIAAARDLEEKQKQISEAPSA